MAETPEPKGEQWLKAFARKRRGQMPPRFELHSADRARLQREVQRQYETGKQGRDAPGWRGLLPRLVLAGAVAALAVALAANFLFPPLAQRRTKMASASADKKEVKSTPAVLERELERADSLAEKPSTERVAERLGAVSDVRSMPERRAQPSSARDEAKRDELSILQLKRAREAGAGPASRAASAPRPTELTEQDNYLKEKELPEVNLQLGQRGLAGADSVGAKLELKDAAATAEPITTLSLGKSAAAPGLEPNTALYYGIDQTGNAWARTQRVRFQNALDTNSTILRHFDYEQIGEQLRLTDADGSTYTGRVVLALPFGTENGNLKANAPREPQFRVIGTSQTLKQVVTFEGNMQTVPLNQAPLRAFRQNAPQTPNSAPAQAQAGANALNSNLRVRGKASVGTNEIQIDGVPVQPPN